MRAPDLRPPASRPSRTAFPRVFRSWARSAAGAERWRAEAVEIHLDAEPRAGRDGAPADQLEEQEDLARLREALLDLRPDEKEVFLLRQNGGLTYEEIADLRKAPVGTVKTQMRSALQKLRKVLA
jgi:RNA polymerase sigma-70 factor (ECF subfamily)